MDRLLVIVATKDIDKIETAVRYAAYANSRGWFDDVEVIFFGPSEKVIASNLDLLNNLIKLAKDNNLRMGACKAIADEQFIANKLEVNGINVFYVGEYISNQIRNGVKVMVW